MERITDPLELNRQRILMTTRFVGLTALYKQDPNPVTSETIDRLLDRALDSGVTDGWHDELVDLDKQGEVIEL